MSTCEKCSGVGWVIVPGEKDGVERALRCECQRVSGTSLDQLLSAADIDRAYARLSLDSYEPYNEKQREALKICRKYVEVFPNLEEVFGFYKGLLFAGPCGTGKTHLAVSVLKGVLEKGYRGQYIGFLELLRKIKESYDPNSETSTLEVLQPILESDVLVLDDFGSHHITGWIKDTVFDIVNYRYRKEKPMIVATNLMLEHESSSSDNSRVGSDKYTRRAKISADGTLEERLGPAVVSRLFDSCVVMEVDGRDHRRTVRREGLITWLEMQGFRLTDRKDPRK